MNTLQEIGKQMCDKVTQRHAFKNFSEQKITLSKQCRVKKKERQI